MNPTVWTDEMRERVGILTRSGLSYRSIAARLKISRESVRTELKRMNLKPENISTSANYPKTTSYPPKPKFKAAPIIFPHFEDHASADNDKYTGRRPQRESAWSLISSTAGMCAE